MTILELSRPASGLNPGVSEPSSAAIRLDRVELVRGFAHGMHSPGLRCLLDVPAGEMPALGGRFAAIRMQAETWPGFEHIDPALMSRALSESTYAGPLAEFVLSSTIWLQSLSGVPVTSHGVSMAAKGNLLIFVPVQEAVAPLVAKLLVSLVRAANRDPLEDDAKNIESAELRALCTQLQREVKKLPPNTAYLMCAARRGNIPVMAKIDNFFTFGQGCRSVTLNSSLSAKESFFGTAIAKDKIVGARLLGQAGLPVAEQAKIARVEEAIGHAGRIGYPVVIKPSDLDGGNGVFPGLQNDEELERAFTLARAKSANIVIEKHVAGFDYRLLVAKGELIAAIERKPAQVEGDGKSAVIDLMVAENARRRPTDGGPALLMPLPNDAETQSVLESQGLTLETVPAAGQLVKLRLACNHAQGGTVSWCLDRVHEANVRLALHIAEIFSLQVAGIDFITTDISRPWWEVESAICEVNAQPSMGRPTPHGLFDKLLAKFLPDGPTIPQVAIAGAPDEVAATMDALEAILAKRGFTVGAVRPSGTYLQGNLIGRHKDVLQGHRMIVMHPRATVALVGVTSSGDLRSGLASPKLDYVVPAGTDVNPLARLLARAFEGRIVALQSLLSP